MLHHYTYYYTIYSYYIYYKLYIYVTILYLLLFLILQFRKLKQEDCEFKDNLGCIVRLLSQKAGGGGLASSVLKKDGMAVDDGALGF